MSTAAAPILRRVLDGLYTAAGYLAAAFLVGIGVTIVVQIACRHLGITFDSTELAGFCLAAATFLGLAHTFRSGAHVRITLATDRLPLRARRFVEIANCLVGSAAIGFLAWHATALVLQSLDYHDVSPGLLAIPFWIPQAGFALGIVLFALALIDDLVSQVFGAAPSYAAGDADQHAE
ncbi:TRAP transporter small permease [Salipiger mangrovisoli]|uniref:TRAP transporter small permease protein n=1 Tax=Salipiger mangrovisoli TaxID=2865933 RepID=A0ABR9WYU3_9RHOB|nr:TRAP transporter small permease subunit [Salipiger mangrovisoli]MBE9636469.1 TRAP transporter small permease subunit [Salipiger mangrovisoli]